MLPRRWCGSRPARQDLSPPGSGPLPSSAFGAGRGATYTDACRHGGESSCTCRVEACRPRLAQRSTHTCRSSGVSVLRAARAAMYRCKLCTSRTAWMCTSVARGVSQRTCWSDAAMPGSIITKHEPHRLPACSQIGWMRESRPPVPPEARRRPITSRRLVTQARLSDAERQFWKVGRRQAAVAQAEGLAVELLP
jgi:hypothetical protein